MKVIVCSFDGVKRIRKRQYVNGFFDSLFYLKFFFSLAGMQRFTVNKVSNHIPFRCLNHCKVSKIDHQYCMINYRMLPTVAKSNVPG